MEHLRRELGSTKFGGIDRKGDGNVSGPGKTSTEGSMPWTIEKKQGRAKRPAGIATLDLTLAKESILPC
jgi:hypothetical protein